MEYTESVAELLRTRIGELEAVLESHRSAVAAVEGRSRDDSDALFGASLRERRTRQPVQKGARRGRRTTTGQATKQDEPGQEERRPSTQAQRNRDGRRGVAAGAVLGKLEQGQDQARRIALYFGVPISAVRARLVELQKAGKATRTGERRSTRWHATTAAAQRRQPANPEPAERSSTDDGNESSQSHPAAGKSPPRDDNDQPAQDPAARNRAPRDDGDGDISAEVVLDALREGRNKAADIAGHFEVPVRMVRRRLHELEDAGRIRRRGR
jgi:predicted Rossmann fold nucleotide-binding protein DprA/Smf involved in DNA uptake